MSLFVPWVELVALYPPVTELSAGVPISHCASCADACMPGCRDVPILV